jgi:hypothetical protein
MDMAQRILGSHALQLPRCLAASGILAVNIANVASYPKLTEDFLRLPRPGSIIWTRYTLLRSYISTVRTVCFYQMLFGEAFLNLSAPSRIDSAETSSKPIRGRTIINSPGHLGAA